MARRLMLVPFERTWLDHATLDLNAIYRRPQKRRNLDTDELEVIRDEHGFTVWDITTAMTIRNHVKYLAKGMEYVTLSSEDDIIAASAPSLAQWGAVPLGRRAAYPMEKPGDYIQQPTGVRGPWNCRIYMQDEAEAHAERVARLDAHVAERGPDYAEMFERQTDPDYVLPASYRQAAAASDEAPKRKRGRPPKVQPEAPVEVTA